MRYLSALVLLALLACASLLGCGPYNEPKYEEVATNETAYAIPLEGDVGKQVKFGSPKELDGMKLFVKRFQIPRRESTTGRMWYSFQWIDTVKVVKVSRAPVSQQWFSAKSGEGNGIWVESSDSVGFCTGFAVVAMILEEDTSLFLYKYNGAQLPQVMDSEIRARVQAKVAEFSARYKMDLLREKKMEMLDEVNKDVVPFFKERGITITTIGNFGGFTYENPKIQDSIDNVFIAQQEKNVAAAMLAAQKDKNQKLLEEGQGEASKVKEVAKGKAEAVETEAKAQANAINMVAEATKKAGSDPVFIQIKTLETVMEQIKRWNGQYPTFMMNGGGNQNPLLLLQLPVPAQK